MNATRMFLGLPDLQKLCCVVATLQENNVEDPRSRQRITCRELVLLHSDVLACPSLDSFDHIQVVMATPFLQSGVLQLFGERRRLQLGPPRCVSPGVLRCCLSFSLITRLAPSWNKVGSYLVAGRDFLSEIKRLEAVSMELSTTDGELCLNLRSTTVTLPPTTLQDFDLPPLVRSRFCRDVSSVLDPSPNGQPVWCHVLPSMKKGQIMSISRQLHADGPFSSYRDLQRHWRRLYGYQLPDLPEDNVVYCHVYFRLLGEKLFSYPLSCIRLQPIKPWQQADQQGALHSFLADVREKLQAVCGFTVRLTTKPCQRREATAEVPSARMLLSHHLRPSPPSPPPLVPLSWSQPPSFSSSFATSSFTCSSTTPTSSTSSWMLLSSHHCPPSTPPPSTSSSNSCLTSSTHPNAPTPLIPKVVPTFSTAATFKQRQQVKEGNGGGGAGGGGGSAKLVGRRVTLPLHRNQGHSSSSSSPARPPPFIPVFGRRPKPLAAAATASPTSKPLPLPALGHPATIDPSLEPNFKFPPKKLPRLSARRGGPVMERQARSASARLNVELRVRISLSQEDLNQNVVSSLTQV